MNSVKTELEANCKAAAKEVVAFEDPFFAVKYIVVLPFPEHFFVIGEDFCARQKPGIECGTA